MVAPCVVYPPSVIVASLVPTPPSVLNICKLDCGELVPIPKLPSLLRISCISPPRDPITKLLISAAALSVNLPRSIKIPFAVLPDVLF